MATVRDKWEMPPPPAKCYAEAFCDFSEWRLVWRGKDGREYGAIEWPFVDEVASGLDLERVGFHVICA